MVLMNLSEITKFPSLCVEYVSISFFFLALILLIYYKICCLYLPIFCMVSDYLHLKCISNCNTFFLSFKGLTHAYLLKIPITHNKNLNNFLNLLINCISVRSAPQILSIKVERTFLFLNFLIVGLCNSSSLILCVTLCLRYSDF